MKALAILAPPPEVTIAQWADAKRRLSSEASAEPGSWRTDRAAYQRGIMDAISDPTIEIIVMMSSAQVGKTELLLNTVGFHVDQDPAPIMVVMPTERDAETWSKDWRATRRAWAGGSPIRSRGMEATRSCTRSSRAGT
jgi:phage terminase large subunit GpA-like protein